MAKFIEHRAITRNASPAWQLEQKTWKDNDITRYRHITHHEQAFKGSIKFKIIAVRDDAHVHTEIPLAKINHSIASSNSLLEAIKFVTAAVWGEYILVLEDIASGRRAFMADPLHSVRLYYKADSHQGIRIDTSVEKLLLGATIDWNIEYLCEFATTQFGQLEETAFLGIKAVPPGSTLFVDIDGTHLVERTWYPKAPNHGDAQALCARAMSDVYSTIARSNLKICAAISGGVDSSSGAIFLRKALGPDVPLTAVHLFSTTSPECNERSMAARVAESIGAALLCIDLDTCLPFADLSTEHPPSSLNQDMLFLRIDKAISEAIGPSSVIVEGQGGDLLFNAAPDARAVLDARRDRGWAFALSTAKTLAMLHNESIPRVLLMAAKLTATQKLFRRDSTAHAQSMSKLLHPCRRDLNNISPYRSLSNQRHVSHIALDELDRFLTIMTPTTDLFLTRRINPFLAQPIVEAAMSIKTYDSFDCRNDRTVLRNIAHDITPTDVLRRRTKGTFDVGFIKGIQSNYDAFYELVRNGVLMRAGRINERELHQALKEIRVGQGAAAIGLALLGCVEIYCSSWQQFLSKRRAQAR